MATLSQRSFAGGELTPSLYSRADLAKYQTSLRTCRNYYVLKHGGARQRPGTEFIGEVKDSTKAVRLIPFLFDSVDNYVLEFGDLYIRFIKNDEYIYEATKAITAITQANPGVVTITAHGYSNGEEVQINDVVGMTELNGRNFKVNNVTANTFELQDMTGTNFDTSGLTAYVSGGTAKRIYEITSPASEADLFEINYAQQNDVITLTSKNFASVNLARISDTDWQFISLDNNAIPKNSVSITSISPGTNVGPAADTYQYELYGVDSEGRVGGNDGFLNGLDAASEPTALNPVTITWSSATNCVSYLLYKRENGVKYTEGPWVLIGEIPDSSTGTNTFVDDGTVPDEIQGIPTINFTELQGPFRAVTYYQQRLVYGGSFSDEPDSVLCSRIGSYGNFYNSYDPITADSPIKFNIAGRNINPVRHLLDLNGLIIFTETSEIAAQGDAAGTLTPTDINLRVQSYHGIGDVAPLVVNNVALFVQARGSIIRDLQYKDSVSGYTGRDLSIFSTHLFEGYSITDWTYQKVPDSIVWAIRNDGTLLGMTFMNEHEVIAWHRHDFDGGLAESVASIPAGGEDALYVVVNRTIDGRTTRYVEKLSTAKVVGVTDVKRMDSYLTVDGTNTAATTMTLSGGTTWAYDETITLTASASYFVSTDVGKEIHITGADGTVIKFNIEGFTSATVVTGKPQKTVPVDMRNTAFTAWGKAIQTVEGLWHLEGKTVSVFADGFVVASPYNPSFTTLTVTNGSITMDDHFVKIHVGLPYVSDLETLDVDTIQGETARDKKHIVNQVNVFVEDTRGLWVGAKAPASDTALTDLYEIKLRDSESQADPVELKTEVLNVKIKSEWNSNGRVFIRQVDPVPSTILSIMPEGNFTFRG
jgi:hypothetical protein